MKDFRVLEITESYIKESNQKVFIFDLAEVEYSDYRLPSGKQTYHFGMNGEKFVFDYSSNLSREITESAHTESVVSLDMSDFTIHNDNKNGIIEKNYIHKSVNLFSYSLNKLTKIDFSKENPGCIHKFYKYIPMISERDNLKGLKLKEIKNKYSIGFRAIKVEIQGELHKAWVKCYKIDDKYFSDRVDCTCIKDKDN